MPTITTQSETETAAVARELAPTLRAGDVVLLYGDLGAGKTAFVKGLAEGLGIPREEVSSPTFTLMQEYRGGRLTLFHVDLYRVNDPREIEELGIDEIAADGVLAVEWADKLDALGAEARSAKAARLKPSRYVRAIAIQIAHGEDDQRQIILE